MSQVHQFLPVLDKGDAIGNCAMALRRLFRRQGYFSNIYVWRPGKGLKRECLPYRKHRMVSSPRNAAILHFSIGSPLSDYVKSLPDRKIMIYHNVTPKEYLTGISEQVYYIAKSGRKELASLAGRMELCLCDSEFNRKDLLELGYENVHVVPILMDFSLLDLEPDRRVRETYGDEWRNFLFVGRIAPNKKQEDIIRVFYYYKKFINPRSRLFLVGTARQMPRYLTILKSLVQRLGLRDVIFTGQVTQSELVAFYQAADVFVCMSEHEGFCVPLVEAMYFGVPIVAFDTGAITETLAGAGVLVGEKDHQSIAEMIDLLLIDESLRSRIISVQEERLKYFKNTGQLKARLLGKIKGIMN
ncbi:glycosyltransferase [bacterium]|nr:glycosyltransferase [bacterium]